MGRLSLYGYCVYAGGASASTVTAVPISRTPTASPPRPEVIPPCAPNVLAWRPRTALAPIALADRPRPVMAELSAALPFDAAVQPEAELSSLTTPSTAVTWNPGSAYRVAIFDGWMGPKLSARVPPWTSWLMSVGNPQLLQ